MKFYKRLLAMAIVATVFISVFAFGATAYGSDNNIPFSVKVPGYLGKVYTKAEYRGNSGPEVPWKVNIPLFVESTVTIILSEPVFIISTPSDNVKVALFLRAITSA